MLKPSQTSLEPSNASSFESKHVFLSYSSKGDFTKEDVNDFENFQKETKGEYLSEKGRHLL